MSPENASRRATTPVWVPFAYLVIVGTMAAYLLVMVGMKRTGATLAGLLGMAEPVLIAVLGWALLGESLTGWQMTGVGVAVTGMILAATARRRGVRASEAAPLESSVREPVADSV